ncbi:MAG: YhgE/Pip domain-containing protein [Collinsella sp.]|nr:YhgE/Pip domain-containing protein [Collinsella sp.]
MGNPVALVVTIGVCIIPSLYAWYNIVANWDPYANTSNVRIAVANEDEGTSNEFVGELRAGDEIVEELKGNDQLGWVFTSARSAREGVLKGDYYAAIVIPEEFSADLTSMLTGDFRQPKLEYYVNEKRNAIAPKVTDTGAQTIEEQVNATFVSTVSKTLAQKAQEAGIDLSERAALAGAGMMDALDGAETSLQEVRDILQGLKGSLSSTDAAIASTDSVLEGLSGQIPALADVLDQGGTTLSDTRSSLRTFNTSLNSVLSRGMTQMGSASSKADAAIGTMSGAVVAATGKVDGALADVQMVIDDIGRALSVLEGIPGAEDVVAALQGQLAQLQGVKDALQLQSDDMRDSATAIGQASEAMDTAVGDSIDAISAAQQGISDTALPSLSEGLDEVSAATGDLSGVVLGTEPTVELSRGTLSQLSSTLAQASTTIDQADASLAKIQDAIAAARTDIAALRSSSALGAAGDILAADPAEVADFMSSPVSLKTEAVYPVATYGSGVAPFYTNLALWVGGFVLIAIIKLEVDAEGVDGFTVKQAYMGRWMLLAALGVIQALVACLGDLVIGVQCEQPVLFVVAGVFISLVYVSLIYALAISFKHIGKALAVILVIVQIPGSSGMYPIEMMPAFFQRLHPLLPFTYGINAMRECVGGLYGMDYLLNLLVLSIFLGIAFVVGIWVRPLLLNLNLLFDRHLDRTGVMICESGALPRERYSARVAMRILLDATGYRSRLIARAERFERRYPQLIKIGFAMVFGIPVVLFVLTAVLDLDIDGKIAMLALWIVSVVVADTYMIVVEYIREGIQVQLRVTALSDADLRREIRERMDAIPLVARIAGVDGPAPQKEGVPSCADGSRGRGGDDRTDGLDGKGGEL